MGRTYVHRQAENLNNSDTIYELPVPQPVLERVKIFVTSILCVSMPLIEAEGMVAVEIVIWTEIQPPFGAFILRGHGVKII